MQQALGPRNKRVAAASRLHRPAERKAAGLTLLEGPHLLEAALAAGLTPEVVFHVPSDVVTARLVEGSGLNAVRVDPAALRRLAGTETPRGPVAVIKVPDDRLAPDRDLLVAWEIADPGNVGTMIRVAAAFGWGFATTSNTADPWSPKVLRSGAGGHFQTAICRVDGLRSLREAGLDTIATVVTGGTPPWEVPSGRWAVLIGAEAAGLPTSVLDASDLKVTIPMGEGTESLNAAMASAIIVYELTRSHRRGPFEASV